MQLNYTLQNIGNIDNASITIKPLTIIAGENSSGKTFVTKSLYTVLDFIYKDNFFQANDDKILNMKFKKNFQTINLKELINKNQMEHLTLSLDGLVEIKIQQDQSIDLNLATTHQKLENIIFFDSPLYIKIQKALKKENYIKNEEKYLKGYPQHIEQLYDFLEKEYIDTPDFDTLSKEIQETIKGRLDFIRGSLYYRDQSDNLIPISLTAMGISNIGLIDLLLRNNIINKGSFLIMDEPEVHLHPQWQVFLAQILYKIAKNGANIIIATHSLDFLKAFENILKDEDENAEEIIAINKMPYNEEFTKLSELEKVGYVLDDLSKPFYDLYMQDI